MTRGHDRGRRRPRSFRNDDRGQLLLVAAVVIAAALLGVMLLVNSIAPAGASLLSWSAAARVAIAFGASIAAPAAPPIFSASRRV